MRTITQTEKITLKVKDNELIQNEWITCTLVSSKLNELEQSNNMTYKALRNKFYNSLTCKKFKVETIAGMKCININNPMLATASLELAFDKE